MDSSLTESFLSLMGSAWGIVLMLLFFNGSIIVHEYGHYIAARWRGLKVTRFSLFGLGPKLVSWRGKDGVEYCICALPFGAYVALPQLAEMKSIEGDDGEAVAALPPISYADKMIVSVAGPLFNILFAVVLAAIVWLVGFPRDASDNTTVIGYVQPTLSLGNSDVPSPAAQAGLKPGDKILAIDGIPINRFSQVIELVALGGGRSEDGRPQAVFSIERDGKAQDIVLHPQLVTINEASGDQLRLVGISPAQELLVGKVVAGSPADKAGLQPDDIITEVDGERPHSIAHLTQIFSRSQGKSVAVHLLRGDEALSLSIAPGTIALTRPLVRFFPPHAATPTLEIIPMYPQTAQTQDHADTATAPAESRNLASAETPAHLALYSIGKQGDTLTNYNGDWYLESLNGGRTATVAAALAAAQAVKGGAIHLTLVNTAGQRRDISLPAGSRAELVPPHTQAAVGIVLKGRAILTHPGIASQFDQHITTTFRTLKSLFTPSSNIGVGHLSGPVGIGRVMYILAASDIRSVLWFAVMLNINLAILNLLPIPVLDGGHMFLATLGKLRGRPMPESFVAGLQGTFMFLLLGLMVYILFKDSMRWYGDSETDRAWEHRKRYEIPSQFISADSADAAKNTGD